RLVKLVEMAAHCLLMSLYCMWIFGNVIVLVQSTTTPDYNISGAVEVPPGCWCVCESEESSTLSETELTVYREKVFIETQKNLLLDKTALSATKRMKYSATDNRIIASTFGYTGVVSLVLVFLIFIWMDSTYLHKFAASLGLTVDPKSK
ncbi:sushi von Willebrand factor type a egf and pentraxin domain-containing protein 1, partial [Biomphalaria glabrata]